MFGRSLARLETRDGVQPAASPKLERVARAGLRRHPGELARCLLEAEECGLARRSDRRARRAGDGDWLVACPASGPGISCAVRVEGGFDGGAERLEARPEGGQATRELRLAAARGGSRRLCGGDGDAEAGVLRAGGGGSDGDDDGRDHPRLPSDRGLDRVRVGGGGGGGRPTGTH